MFCKQSELNYMLFPLEIKLNNQKLRVWNYKTSSLFCIKVLWSTFFKMRVEIESYSSYQYYKNCNKKIKFFHYKRMRRYKIYNFIYSLFCFFLNIQKDSFPILKGNSFLRKKNKSFYFKFTLH